MNKEFLAESEHSVSFSFGEYPMTVREAAKYPSASVHKLCIFGSSESRFPISA